MQFNKKEMVLPKYHKSCVHRRVGRKVCYFFIQLPSVANLPLACLQVLLWRHIFIVRSQVQVECGCRKENSTASLREELKTCSAQKDALQRDFNVLVKSLKA